MISGVSVDPLEMTDEELRLQREAEAYYKQQQLRAQRQATGGQPEVRQQLPRREGSAASRPRRSMTNNSNDAGCRVM